jgi:hypothetical protein
MEHNHLVLNIKLQEKHLARMKQHQATAILDITVYYEGHFY